MTHPPPSSLCTSSSVLRSALPIRMYEYIYIAYIQTFLFLRTRRARACRTHANTHTYTHTHTHTRTHTHTHIPVSTYATRAAHARNHIHTYTHTHTHAAGWGQQHGVAAVCRCQPMARADDGVRLVLRRQTYRRAKGLFGGDGLDTDKRRHVRNDPQVLLIFFLKNSKWSC